MFLKEFFEKAKADDNKSMKNYPTKSFRHYNIYDTCLLAATKPWSLVTAIAVLTLCMLGNFACILVVCWNFYRNFLKKILWNTISVKHIWIHFRPDILSGLIWVQNVCRGYQQTTSHHLQVGDKFSMASLTVGPAASFWSHQSSLSVRVLKVLTSLPICSCLSLNFLPISTKIS